MANTFINATSRNIGTSEVVVYTAATKAILIGCNITNVTGSIVPVDIILRKSGNDTYIKKQLRIENGISEEIMKGNKLVFAVGDSLVVKGYVSNSIDVILSLLSGVA
jgi:hypothetical protein